MQTGDSIFHLTMQSFNLSYRDKAITLKGIAFKPNLSNAAMQRRNQYRSSVFSGNVGSLKLVGLNFDSLIYRDRVLIDEVEIDRATVNIFTDQTKPLDMNKFPQYPGQQVAGISLPIRVGYVKAKGLSLVNEEKTPTGAGKIRIGRGDLSIRNFTNLSKAKPLTVDIDGVIEGVAHLKARAEFSYQTPSFTLHAQTGRFDLTGLNAMLTSYSPASVNKGVVDELSFTTHASLEGAEGEMKFLYHDLSVNLELEKKAKWKSNLLSWAANMVIPPSNPASEKAPPRVVNFKATRDRNKGFVNIIIKSMLAGFKETMIMSKENKKEFKQQKKENKKKLREANKAK
jgi:hypothetical protein